MGVEEVRRLIQASGAARVELPRHVFERANRRNVDVSELRESILDCDFIGVRPNNQSDPDFEYSFKATLETQNGLVEVPLYFNVPGTKILVKSIWPR